MLLMERFYSHLRSGQPAAKALVLLLPLLVVALLLALPFVLLAALVAWPLGWARTVLGVLPALLGLIHALHGLKIEVNSGEDRIDIKVI